MKTYTFKIKVDSDKVVVAVNMQLEQFYDSVKMTCFDSLVERYPYAYITASDFYSGSDFMWIDRAISSLKTLLDSKDLKSYLVSDGFCGFSGDESFNREFSKTLEDKASEFIVNELNIVEDEEDKEDKEVDENELSETNKE